MISTDADAPLDTGGTSTIGGVAVGRLGVGCWRMTSADDAANIELVRVALDTGCTFFDTADVYGLDWGGSGFGACEEALGRVFASDATLRGRITLGSKCGIVPGVPYVSTAAHLERACEESLRRLRTDHLDLYQIHRPDLFAHPDEVASGLTALRDRGLVHQFGVSNHTPSQTRALAAALTTPLATTQPEFSVVALAALRDGTLDLAMELGITPLAWSPLGGGRILGDEIAPALAATLDELAATHGTSRAVIALAFVLAHPSRPVALIGTQQPDRVRAMVEATRVPLTRAEVYRIVEASEGMPLP